MPHPDGFEQLLARTPIRSRIGSEPRDVPAIISNPVVSFVSRDADLVTTAPLAGLASIAIAIVILAGMVLSRRD